MATMEANENMIPQTRRMEDEYVRIGTTLFRILNQQNTCGMENEYVPARP